MITLVEALNYRSLRYVHRPLGPFHVLVGPNASGKTTFLDVIGFLRDMVADGLDQALAERTPDPRDLLFRGRGDRLELAVEARIPDDLRRSALKPDLDAVRYQVALGGDRTHGPFEFKAETLMLKKTTPASNAPPTLFPSVRPRPDSLQISIRQRNNDAQVLLATHSPVVLNAARPADVLCFAKDDDGGTDVVLGSEHPTLRQWRGEADLGTLLAAGVLG